jgi:hypothetical protein
MRLHPLATLVGGASQANNSFSWKAVVAKKRAVFFVRQQNDPGLRVCPSCPPRRSAIRSQSYDFGIYSYNASGVNWLERSYKVEENIFAFKTH